MGKKVFLPCIYIVGNDNLTLYIGVTSDLVKRIWLHKLMYYEVFETMEQAILREKQLKRWPRQWKLNLIKKVNSEFEDLYPGLVRDS